MTNCSTSAFPWTVSTPKSWRRLRALTRARSGGRPTTRESRRAVAAQIERVHAEVKALRDERPCLHAAVGVERGAMTIGRQGKGKSNPRRCDCAPSSGRQQVTLALTKKNGPEETSGPFIWGAAYIEVSLPCPLTRQDSSHPSKVFTLGSCGAVQTRGRPYRYPAAPSWRVPESGQS